jgi:hypothetical protein
MPNNGTLKGFQILNDAEWFSRVGTNLENTEDYEFPIMPCSSWEEAIQHCSSPIWQNLCNEMTNLISHKVRSVSVDSYQQWNVIVESVKPLVETLIDEKVRPIARDLNFPPSFVHAIQWDILSLFIESEYSNQVNPGFYTAITYWYAVGRFPCGWAEGEYPAGKLIVY